MSLCMLLNVYICMHTHAHTHEYVYTYTCMTSVHCICLNLNVHSSKCHCIYVSFYNKNNKHIFISYREKISNNFMILRMEVIYFFYFQCIESHTTILFSIFYTHKLLLNMLYSCIYVLNYIINILLLNNERYLENYHTFPVIVFTNKLFFPLLIGKETLKSYFVVLHSCPHFLFAIFSIIVYCSDSLPKSISYQAKFTLNVVSVPKDVMWEKSEKRKNVNRLTSVIGNIAAIKKVLCEECHYSPDCEVQGNPSLVDTDIYFQ